MCRRAREREMSSLRRSTCLVAAVLLVAVSARADDTRDDTVVAIETNVANESPRVALLGATAPGRLVGVSSSSSWSPSVGFGLDGEARIQANDWLGIVWRYGGLHYTRSIDAQDSTTSAGESPVTIHASALNVIEIDAPLLGGLGGEIFFSNVFKIATEVTWGWAYAWSDAQIQRADGSFVQGVLQNDSVYVRLGADACVRFGRFSKSNEALGAWACLTASATHYTDDWSSASVGLKVEL